MAGTARLPLDGDHARNKVLFSDGLLLDLATLERRKLRPQDRMSLRAQATSKAWQPTQSLDFQQNVLDFLQSGTAELCQRPAGQKVIDNFQTMREGGCELVAVLKRYGSWDLVLYLLRFFCRAVSGNERLCEFLYLFGTGSSGKDVLMLLLLRFMGSEPYQYGAMIPGRFVVSGGSSSREGPSPNMAQLEGKRLVWASEAPQHEALEVDFLKAFAEQGGAPISCRRLYREPRAFRPQGALAITSNFEPKVKVKDDEGWARRARVFQTEARFVARPTLLTEHRCDDTLKPRINQASSMATFSTLCRSSSPASAPPTIPAPSWLRSPPR